MEREATCRTFRAVDGHLSLEAIQSYLDLNQGWAVFREKLLQDPPQGGVEHHSSKQSFGGRPRATTGATYGPEVLELWSLGRRLPRQPSRVFSGAAPSTSTATSRAGPSVSRGVSVASPSVSVGVSAPETLFVRNGAQPPLWGVLEQLFSEYGPTLI